MDTDTATDTVTDRHRHSDRHSYKGMITWWDGGQKIRSIGKFEKFDKFGK